MKKKRTASVLCLIVFCAAGLNAQKKPDGEKAMDHVSYLASNLMKGRKSGTAEYLRAAEYVAEKMKEFGLQPGGENGTYFQQVDLKNWRNFNPPCRLDILSPIKKSFVPGRDRDFIPNYGTGSGKVRAPLAFAGYGLSLPDKEWDDFQDLDVQGKIVVMAPDAPGFLEVKTKDKSPQTKIEKAIAEGAAGVLFMDIGETPRRYRNPPGAKKGTCPENFIVLTARPHTLDEIFYASGESWRTLISRTIREKTSKTVSLSVTIEMEAHFVQQDLKAPNVIGLIPGKHDRLKEEYIIVGGHLDHLGVGLDGSIYNGADDNASSIGAMLEVTRVLQVRGFRPDRTLVFAAWAAEEIGLIGSRYYTNHPLYPLEKTAVYINSDMVGCGDTDLVVGGMWEFEELYDIAEKGLREELQNRLEHRIDYRGSDHSAFLRKGVKAVSLRSGEVRTRELDDEHPEYHKPGDTPAVIQPELLQQAAEYTLDILTTLADTPINLMDPLYWTRFLHKDSQVVDLHCDTIGRALRGTDLSLDNERGHVDIPKLKQGAVDLQVFACYVGPPRNEREKHQAANKAFAQIDAVHKLVEDNPESLVLVTDHQDMRQLRGNRKTGVLIGIEGGYAIENELSLLRSFYRCGVRLMTLTHWLDTDWADASGDPEANLGGLTELGEKVVAEMNRLGMVIDVSHVHDETFWDVLKISEHPVVASHSCCRALSDHHRNLSDGMLKALAENGGVIGINFLPDFLDAERGKKMEKLRERLLEKHGFSKDMNEFVKAPPEKRRHFSREYAAEVKKLKKNLPAVNAATVVDHIAHVIKVTGNADHVGLGSDFDGISDTPVQLEHAGKLIHITEELVRRGYEDKDIKKILGGNFLRVFRKVTEKK